MKVTGRATLVSEPTGVRGYAFKQSRLGGKSLHVLERNFQGDCLCLTPDHDGLVDVPAKDIATYTPYGVPR